MQREPIYAALLAKLGAVAGVKKASRRFRMLNDTSAADRPALYLVQDIEEAQTVPGLPTIWTIHCHAIIYVDVGGDMTIAPSTILNPILDGIEAAMAPDNPIMNKNTLGGLVQHCYIAGQIIVDETISGDISIAKIPLELKIA